MSKHWRPDDDFVRTGFRGAYAQRRVRPERSTTGVVPLMLIGAAAAGVGIGAMFAFASPDRERSGELAAPIEWKAVQAAPTRELAPGEVGWQQRADDRAAARPSTGSGQAPSTSSGRADEVRAAFSACKWGGGTNCVVDGDTIYLAGAKIRIAGIDAPETHDYRCATELALGEQAAARLQQLVSSGAITLTSIDRDRDRYGRLLRNVAVDGRDVGDVLIGEGLARAYAGGRRGWC